MTHLLAIGNCMGAAQLFAPMFEQTNIITSFDEAKDLITSETTILYGGGEDISPALYSDYHDPLTYAQKSPSRRDRLERDIFLLGREKGAAHYGICRGAQMLCALSGGKLYQDVSNHNSDHNVKVSPALAYLAYAGDYFGHDFVGENGLVMQASSVHHQMVNVKSLLEKNADTIPILTTESPLSDHYNYEASVLKPSEVKFDNEAFLIPSKRIFGIQGHPEFMAQKSMYVVFAKQMMSYVSSHKIVIPPKYASTVEKISKGLV